MTEPKKKPGRPALPPTERKAANLTFRSRGGMRERLAEAAASNGRSISEEIENRLEQSFELEKRMADFREDWEKRINDSRAEAQKARDEMGATVDEIRREARQAHEETQKEIAEMERQLEGATTALQVVDALIGENKASTDLIRKVAAELMSHPEWDRIEAERKAIADRIHSYILPKRYR